MQKTLMVDLDDVIVSYSEMFVKKCNRIMEFTYNETEKLDISDVVEYDFYKAFEKKFPTLREEYNNVLETILTDSSMYIMPIYTKESRNVFDIINMYKNRDYKIILHTKVSTVEMIQSKCSLFKHDPRFNVFDEIILDWEKGLHSPKPYHYDVIIDDSPYNIQHYLENNPNGEVYMTLRPWNSKYVNSKVMIID